MTNLVRYCTWRPLARSHWNSFDANLFDTWFERSENTPIKLDVSENPQAYFVKADLPGASKDQIKVDIDEDVLRISFAYQQEKNGEGKQLLWSERVAGETSRTIRLPQAIDAEQAEAKYSDGVLQLTLPKQSAKSARQLTIN